MCVCNVCVRAREEEHDYTDGQSLFICTSPTHKASLWLNIHCLRTLGRASSPAGLLLHHLSNVDNKNSCFPSRVHMVEGNEQGGMLESIATNQVYC